MKETVYTHRVKCEKWKVKEFGTPEMWGKNGICLENGTYVGKLFVGRWGQN